MDAEIIILMRDRDPIGERGYFFRYFTGNFFTQVIERGVQYPYVCYIKWRRISLYFNIIRIKPYQSLISPKEQLTLIITGRSRYKEVIAQPIGCSIDPIACQLCGFIEREPGESHRFP